MPLGVSISRSISLVAVRMAVRRRADAGEPSADDPVAAAPAAASLDDLDDEPGARARRENAPRLQRRGEHALEQSDALGAREAGCVLAASRRGHAVARAQRERGRECEWEGEWARANES